MPQAATEPAFGADASAPNVSPLLAAAALDLQPQVASVATAAEVLDDDLDRLGPEGLAGMVADIRARALDLQALVENLLCSDRAEQAKDARLTSVTMPATGIVTAAGARAWASRAYAL